MIRFTEIEAVDVDCDVGRVNPAGPEVKFTYHSVPDGRPDSVNVSPNSLENVIAMVFGDVPLTVKLPVYEGE